MCSISSKAAWISRLAAWRMAHGAWRSMLLLVQGLPLHWMHLHMRVVAYGFKHASLPRWLIFLQARLEHRIKLLILELGETMDRFSLFDWLPLYPVQRVEDGAH